MKISSCIILVLTTSAMGFDWPSTDADIDALLRQKSAKYKQMSDAVRARQGYRIETEKSVRLGNVRGEQSGKGLVVELNPSLAADRRVTILIWEIANAYQRPRFDEIDRRARDGTIQSHQEFGLRMELIEYDSFRHHKEVLAELQKSLGPIGADFLFFINPDLKNFDDYQIPYAHDYIEAQSKSGHTRSYEKWYYRQKGQEPPF